jgi:hypothetical protein
MTHELAEDLFVGWYGSHPPSQPAPSLPSSITPGLPSTKPVSWLVAAGKNPAYDYFPCQHQVFYRGKGRGQMWYEPIFKVGASRAGGRVCS